jgi:rhamnose transport system ATP-binding protein
VPPKDAESPPRSLAAVDVTVDYGSTRALSAVSLEILPGEVHALCGENGAGKSSLIRCLGGALAPTSGSVFLDGSPLPASVHAAEASGVAVIHQEPLDFPDLTIAETIFLGRETTIARFFLDRRSMRRAAKSIITTLGVDLDPDRAVASLSLAERQMTAIARAVSIESRFLILDEPTASLSAHETAALFRLIHELKARGTGMLFVSHRLDEVFRMADRTTVLLDGKVVGTYRTSELTHDSLVQKMVGRDIVKTTPTPEVPDPSPVVLSVEDLGSPGKFTDVSFKIARGEIVGLFGLIGAGRSEVAAAIAGIDRKATGTVKIGTTTVRSGNIAEALAAGICLSPEDRRGQGLALSMSIADNMALHGAPGKGARFVRDFRAESAAADAAIRDFSIKARGAGVIAGTLSGGNQQKVLLAKWMALRPTVLILDEPTRGVDIGAKSDIHAIIRRAAADGRAVLLISSEIAEIKSLAHRILVMRSGRISEELPPSSDEDVILKHAMPESVLGGVDR